MSFWIEMDSVVAVLLIDGWHAVAGESFDLEYSEFAGEELCFPGATWTEVDGTRVCCLRTAILAVRTKPPQSAGNSPSSPADTPGRVLA